MHVTTVEHGKPNMSLDTFLKKCIVFIHIAKVLIFGIRTTFGTEVCYKDLFFS